MNHFGKLCQMPVRLSTGFLCNANTSAGEWRGMMRDASLPNSGSNPLFLKFGLMSNVMCP